MRSMIIGALIAFVSFIILTPALAHGLAEWIQRGGVRNGGGQLCCGERDCIEIPGEQVKAIQGGYRVILDENKAEIVPYPEAQPSPDGAYWRCAWPRPEDRKCFFAPPPAM